MTEVIPRKILDLEQWHNTILSHIGNTPLLEIPIKVLNHQINITSKIFAKAECFNPGGSVKDRSAWKMIRQGLLEGKLVKGMTIIDASSGNTGIALAMIGAVLDYPVTICIPANASRERKQILKAYGATIILTDPLEGTDGAIQEVRRLISESPENYYYTDQYNNSANWMAHYQTTAEEIIQQTQGKVTHFVAGLGTSGTFTGITRRLKEENNDIVSVAMQPDTPFHGLEGLKHMDSAIPPGIYQPDLADINITVTTNEAQEMTINLVRHTGMLVGISSGANVVAAIKIAKEVEDGTIVTILCDSGERYLSDNFWR